eukprot:jgi/Hompol1/2605/HPOL_002978-RA
MWLVKVLELLDERISNIGDQTLKVEKTIRTIKGDNQILPDRRASTVAPGQPNSCIKTLFGHTDSVDCLDFESPYGLMVSGSADKTLRVWDLSTHRCKGVLSGHTGWIRSLQMRGFTVMSGSGDSTVRQWDITSLESGDGMSADNTARDSTSGGKQRLMLLAPPTRPSADSIEDDDSVNHLVRTFEGHSGAITALMFDSDSLLTGSADKTIRQWDMATGEVLNILNAFVAQDTVIDSFSSLSASFIGESTSTAGANSKSASTPFAKLSPIFATPEFQGWAAINTAPVVASAGVSASDTPLAFDPVSEDTANDGFVLAGHPEARTSADSTPGLQAQNLQSDASLPAGKITGGYVGALYFREHALAAGYGDGIVRLWDLRTGRYHRELAGHLGPISAVRFDDFQVFSGSHDRSVFIWDLRLGHKVEEIRVEGIVTGLYHDHTRLSIAAGTKDIRIYQRSSGTMRIFDGHTRPVRTVKHMGTTLVSGGMDATLRVWNADI